GRQGQAGGRRHHRGRGEGGPQDEEALRRAAARASPPAAPAPPLPPAGARAAAWGLACACSPPEPLPQDQIERARAALRRARIEAAAGAPAELAKAIAASTLLERRLAERQTAALRPRKADDVEQLALAAESSALAALRQARLRQALARKALAAQRSDLEERLSALSEELEHMPGDQRLRAHFERARLELELEKAGERRGDLGAAAAGRGAAVGARAVPARRSSS